MKRLYWFRKSHSPDLVLLRPVAAVSLKQAVHKLGLVKNGPLWAHNAYMSGDIELDRTERIPVENDFYGKKEQMELALPKGS